MNKESVEKKPIKRHKVLQPLSRDHHHTLLLVWKIRKGLSNGIGPQRIKKYVEWFYKTYADAHFELEEKYIYPVLNQNDALVVKALEEHKELKKLFAAQNNLTDNLTALAVLLETHIRFEERILLNVIQEKATDRQLQFIAEHIPELRFEENESDSFWK